MFYQVTALYKNNAEIGYAEGENLSDVKREALEQVPSFYPKNEVILKVLQSNGYQENIEQASSKVGACFMPSYLIKDVIKTSSTERL